MKIIAVPLAVLFAASVVSAQMPAPATPVKATDAVKVVPDKPADPKAKPADPKAKKDPKAKEKVYTIPGLTISRPNGTFLGLQVLNNNFVLSFYDAKKKPMAPDITRATAHWPNLRSIHGDNFTVLNSSGNALVGVKPVVPPLTFIVRITLLDGEGDDAKAVENYSVHL